jgi:hypothetical protein
MPLVLRAVPELLMGPYIVGFDTLGYYVPNTLLWLHGGVTLSTYFATAPLFYTILVSIVAWGEPLILVLKILPVLLHGFLGLSVYGYARKGLDWSPSKSTIVALISTLYFVALRVSWDLLRNEMGLIFFFAVLTLLNMEKYNARACKQSLLIALAMIAVTLSHQLVSVIMLGVVAFIIANKLLRKEYARVINLILVSLPATLIFVIIFLASFGWNPSLDFSLNIVWPLTSFPSYQSMLISNAGFFLYCYLSLLPLAVLSFKRLGNLQLRSWLIFSLILLFIPVSNVSNFRWLLMLTYPLAFYTTETLSRLKSIKWKRYKITIHEIAVMYLMLSTTILSFGFMFATPENPFLYFRAAQNTGLNGYIYQIPSSMLQNTISVNDCNDTANAFQWLKGNMNSSSLLLAHRAFYGWALLTLGKDQVVLYEFDNPANIATSLTQGKRAQIYLVWWIEGQGWYGLPTVPSVFQEVYRSGKIAVYVYEDK